MAKRDSAEATAQLPTVGCELCLGNYPGKGYQLKFDDSGNRVVVLCDCMRRREAAKLALEQTLIAGQF